MDRARGYHIAMSQEVIDFQSQVQMQHRMPGRESIPRSVPGRRGWEWGILGAISGDGLSELQPDEGLSAVVVFREGNKRQDFSCRQWSHLGFSTLVTHGTRSHAFKICLAHGCWLTRLLVGFVMRNWACRKRSKLAAVLKMLPLQTHSHIIAKN